MVGEEVRIASAPAFTDVDTALDELRRGGCVVVADDERPECGADVLFAAEHATAEAIAFLAVEARGILYLALTAERGRQLDLPPLQPEPGHESWATDAQRWKGGFRALIDARDGVTTGISAHDRARTVALAVDPEAGPDAFVRPGHMLPVIAHPQGLVGRPHRNEAFVDLPRLAGLRPAGVASSVMTREGEVATLADLVPWSERHGVPVITIDTIVRAAVTRLPWLEAEGGRSLDTGHGAVHLEVYRHPTDGRRIRVLRSPGGAPDPVPVAVVTACAEGEALRDARCPHRDALAAALERLSATPGAVAIVVEARGACAAAPPLGDADRETAALVAGAMAHAGLMRVRSLCPDEPTPGWLADWGLALTA